MAFKILALEHREGHNLGKSRRDHPDGTRARQAERRGRASFSFEFERPAFLTLGTCYGAARLSSWRLQSILRRIDTFRQPSRNRRGAMTRRKILKLDDAVSAAVEKLKAKGLTSPYLKPFVVSRVNYTRFSKATTFDFDETLDKIIASAAKFNVDRVKQEDVAKSGGGAPDDE